MKELNSQRVLDRLNKIIADGNHLLTTVEPRYTHTTPTKRSKPDGEYVDGYLHLKFTISALHFIESTLSKDAIFYRRFHSIVGGITDDAVRRQIIILESLYEVLEDSWYWSAQGLANAGVFSNMLEEADHLLEKGFKLPAAVLAGCVLETHLKSLSKRNDIDTFTEKANGKKVTKKASALNQELCTEGVYSMNESKEVTNYLGIRNSAAHGNEDEFDSEQVTLLVRGVSSFISRNPI
ncbi:hypothetical protein OMR72_004731 [Vibrio parahaemolyticus]|uniref:hypothetical protein n=1 Tax=Vibrio parahaemolyticus TaxID=670 RepID=UPI00111FDF1C|nr:hypothetical protein [Vibrio parahaemolyticus]EJG1014407.1 hypothetical protein [Vibrio parahaemolyticus]EKA8936396.1 hypothetical protein [Vibrio parahaemolyticus]EKF6612087.1 hypothetical protein [Vibrio parahaemolyticus]MBE4164786.1 hypothetical protein [Vibrio parahaemolyticus]MDF4907414.1 hypothetical protein [Vibrio parahaemolyticus]